MCSIIGKVRGTKTFLAKESTTTRVLTNSAAPLVSTLATAKLRDNYRTACEVNNTAPSGYILQIIDYPHLQVSKLLLGDPGVVSLSQSMSYHLLTIDLSSNGISDAGAQALALSMEKNSLTELDLSKNQIGDEGGVALVNSMTAGKVSGVGVGVGVEAQYICVFRRVKAE